jgi:hypothetical protein
MPEEFDAVIKKLPRDREMWNFLKKSPAPARCRLTEVSICHAKRIKRNVSFAVVADWRDEKRCTFKVQRSRFGPIHTLLARIDRARHQSAAQKSPAEYLKSFYYDTAGPSHPGAVMGAVYTVGINHILFGTDLPFGEDGDYVERALDCVEGADLSVAQKEMIYRGNAARIFKL